MLKNFEESEANSQFTRNFSKEYSQLLRDETAHNIREARNKYRNNSLTYEEIMESNDKELISSYNQLKENFWGRLFKSDEYLIEKAILNIAIFNFEKKKTNDCIDEIKEKFNKKIIEFMQNTPLKEEEQNQFLCLENVCKMNLEDYLSLMNRLSGFYFAHITRFGLKEELGVHGGGMDGVIDSFTAILKSRKLGGLVDNLLSEETYAKWLFNWFINREKLNDASREEVINLFLKYFYEKEFFNDCPPPDASSTHFAYSMVDKGYGGESGYGIYFYFPAEVIGKNFQHDLCPSRGVAHDSQNDRVVWNAENGIPIDAGIVCIPENVPVDKRSGSKYVMNEKREPVLRNECNGHINYIESIKNEFDEVLKIIAEEYLNIGKNSKDVDVDKFFIQTHILDYAKKFGFMDAEEAIITNPKNYYFDALDSDSYYESFYRDKYLDIINQRMFLFREFIEKNILFFGSNDSFLLLKDFYSTSHLCYKSDEDIFFRLFLEKPSKDNTISSMDYWENYFKENPNVKPSKIIFYNNKKLFTGVRPDNYYLNALDRDDIGKNYVDLVSKLKFKSNIVGMNDFFIQSGLNNASTNSNYLEQTNRYPNGYLEFWKRVEPKIREVLGKMYDEIKTVLN